MSLKSGSPTSYSQQFSPVKRHQRGDGVGENYHDRRAYEQKSKAEGQKVSFFGKIKDFFFTPKIRDVKDFAPNAEYVSGSFLESFRNLENGIGTPSKSVDEELLKILNSVK